MEDRNTNFDRCYGFTHVIQKGDTLYKLSKQYHVKVSALILANPFVNIYNLQVGDEICIPRIRPVVIPVTPYPQPPYTRPGVIQPRSAEEDNGRSVDSGEQMDSGEMEDAMHAYDNGMRQRTTDDPMRREQERTTVVPENQKCPLWVGMAARGTGKMFLQNRKWSCQSCRLREQTEKCRKREQTVPPWKPLPAPARRSGSGP